MLLRQIIGFLVFDGEFFVCCEFRSSVGIFIVRFGWGSWLWSNDFCSMMVLFLGDLLNLYLFYIYVYEGFKMKIRLMMCVVILVFLFSVFIVLVLIIQVVIGMNIFDIMNDFNGVVVGVINGLFSQIGVVYGEWFVG